MKRDVCLQLQAWSRRSPHLPLILRGARQVGKSHLVRELAKLENLELIELNFERDPDLIELFHTNDAKATWRSVVAWSRRTSVADRSLLFLDEAQAAPSLLSKLRWFAEEMPELRIITAGSLLDFVLTDHKFSMPVGRVTFMHLEPMSFPEFVEAVDSIALRQIIDDYRVGQAIPGPLHTQLMRLFREYLIVGGMPGVVERYRVTRSLEEASSRQQDLLAAYRDDFGKYSSPSHHPRLQKVLRTVPRQVGRKFKYSNVDREERSASLRQALELLGMARICHRVFSTDATGLPLGADLDERTFKVIFLDVGLVSASLGLAWHSVESAPELVLTNEGALAEQVVGQALRLLLPPNQEPQLYYWVRDERGAESEVDYVVQLGGEILPIEVKACKSGTLKSLHLLMSLRGLPRAVRFNSEPPSVADLDLLVRDGRKAKYQLVSLPLYLAGNLRTVLGPGGAHPPPALAPEEAGPGKRDQDAWSR